MLHRLTQLLARAAHAVDARLPVAKNRRTGIAFGAGLGPHSETETFKLIVEEARLMDSTWLTDAAFGIPYPESSRQKCDLRLSTAAGDLFVEGKLLRLKGDNGKPNDNMLMHIVSPYPQHRSALTDCIKMAKSHLPGVKVVNPDLPLEPAIRAFETLAQSEVRLGKRHEAQFCDLKHPVHREGSIMAWRIEASASG